MKTRTIDQRKEKRVVVVGRNYSSNLCMARSFGKAGYEVEVLRIFQTKPKFHNLMRLMQPDARSSYVKVYQACICNNDNSRIVDALIAMADPNSKKLLVPADDLAAAVADESLELLGKYYLLPSVAGKPNGISRLMSKDLQMLLAEQAGLPVVNSCLIKTDGGAFAISDSVRYPCFIKPNISKNSAKSKMRRCESEAELRKTLTEFSRTGDIEMLVEDYVEIAREYALLGLSTKDGTVCPGLFVAEKGGHGERKGVTMVGRILPCAEHQKLIGEIARFVESLEYEGLFDVDLIEDAAGRVYFVELNLRYGASGYAVTESGVNLPGMYADSMFFGIPIDRDCRIEVPGKRFVSEKVLLDEYSRNFVSLSDVRKMMESVEIHFIRDEQDLHPYRHFRKFYLFGMVTRIYFRLKALL